LGVQVIVTHDMADFDALASAVAAQKLHPAAHIVLGRRLGQEVRGYLALHKDRFRTLNLSELSPQAVSHVVVVDVRRKSRLGDFAELLARAERGDVEVSVYDHHPAADDDLVATHELVEPVGSTTTVLLEQMIDRGLVLDDVEATLLALGIHADTGSLTYACTTARDAHALGWLLEQGVSLPVLARYLRPAFTLRQRRLLAHLLECLEVERIGHLDVAFVIAELPQAIDGFGEVVSEVSALTSHAAVVAVFGVGRGRVQVVARSRSALIDVGQAVQSIGGGGHAAAASATLKETEASQVMRDLRSFLRQRPPRARRVAELMTSPVHTVTRETLLGDVARSLANWRHTGVPVLQAGELVGIVSHRDVERAAGDGRLQLPVSSCMSQHVETIGADAAPEEALRLMEQKDVGRLPVLRDGKLVGIVTRSDLLRILYGSSD